MQLGQISDEIGSSVAGEVIKGILESVQGSILAMMVNEKMLENFREPIAKKVNEVTIGRIVTMVKDSDVPVRVYAIEAYERLVEEKLGDMMEDINISGIVQEKIPQPLKSVPKTDTFSICSYYFHFCLARQSVGCLLIARKPVPQVPTVCL